MTSTMPHWRAEVDPEDLREYDRFGPWIDHVRQLSDMPRRFRAWWPELGAARYLLKVPRSYDRSQVSPGMDLYESLIAVLPDQVCVLRADATRIVRRDVARDEIVASVHHTSLLTGRWSLLLADGGSLEVPFNSVSGSLISEVERFLMAGAGPTGDPTPVAWADPPRDHLSRSVIATLDAEEPNRFAPVHVEEPGRPCRNERNGRRRSAGMMALVSDDQLLIFNRDLMVQPLLRRPNFAINLVRVPFRAMTSFEVRLPEETSPPTFSQLVITCGRQAIVQPCLSPPHDVAAVLLARGVPPARQAQ